MHTSLIGHSIRRLRQKWAEGLDLPFRDFLPASLIAEAAKAEGLVFRNRIFPPLGNPVGIPGTGARRGFILPSNPWPRHRPLPAP
jgi:hypothetical protein